VCIKAALTRRLRRGRKLSEAGRPSNPARRVFACGKLRLEECRVTWTCSLACNSARTPRRFRGSHSHLRTLFAESTKRTVLMYTEFLLIHSAPAQRPRNCHKHGSFYSIDLLGSSRREPVVKIRTLAALTVAAISLTGGVGESLAGVPTTASVVSAVTASAQNNAVENVAWRRYGWRDGRRRCLYGWRDGYCLGPGYGWGWGPAVLGAALWGGPVVGGSCWSGQPTDGGWREVWVCGRQ
jgi:hypothetical protein